MTKLGLSLSIVFIILLWVLPLLSLGEQPSYSECKPHIDATILDLAAQAIRSGEKSTKKEHHSDHSKSSTHHSSTVPHHSSQKKDSTHHASSGKTQKLSGFDKIINVIFGVSPEPRDPKFARPWITHPEFRKKIKNLKEGKKVDVKPGIIASTINKAVATVFTVSREPRDKKWAKPWTTHKEHHKKDEHKKKKKAFSDKPRFSIMNSFVEIIFGKDTSGPRDPKYAKPWTTHKGIRGVKESKEKGKPKIAAANHNKGGIIHSLITLVFDAPKGPRDTKWARPWTTHEEHKRSDNKSHVKRPKESGIISKSISKLVYMAFGESGGKRDPKWAKPWQTHTEHSRSPKSDAPIKKMKAESYFKLKFVNSMVDAVFGKINDERDPKWARPWQTHSKKSEITAPAGTMFHKDSKATSRSETSKSKDSAAKDPKLHDQHESKTFQDKSDGRNEKSEKSQKQKFSHKNDEVVDSEQKRYVQPSSKKDEKPHDTSKMPKEHKTAPSHENKKEKFIEDDDIVIVPSTFRPRDHIDSILGLDETAEQSSVRTNTIADSTLRELKKIYETAIKPLETIYKYQDISNRHLSDAELFGTPLILLLGPYSTGKSTFINYLLGVEFTEKALKTGTPPSHGVFRIIKYGEQNRHLDGTDLSGHWSFSFLQKFGQNFVDQLRGRELDLPLLKKVTFVEAPGILEMRRPGERLYPFNDVVQWFIDRADLILVMFDYTKLDAGYELEAILDQLKGREAQSRILLNKADQVPPEELIKVQGSLFWNLSPLLGMSAPPTVYAGSFSSYHYRPTSPVKLFQAQEEALLHDIAKSINSRVDNRIAIARRHAVRVRNHAQMVDTYLNTFYKNKGFLTSKHKLAEEIVENPHAYNIYEGVSLHTNISRYDLPDAEVYRDFFRIHNLYHFRTLRDTCTYLTGCPLTKLEAAISNQLSELLTKYRRLVYAAAPGNKFPDANMQPGVAASVAHSHHSKVK